MPIEKLQKLMLDADGHGFYQADDAEPEDAVCEYSKAQAHIDRLEQENAELKAQLEALSWREIDDTHLPKVGDEVGRLPESYALKIRGNSKILVVTGSMVRVFSDDSGARLWIEQDWTHYRPHTPPQPKGDAKEATDAK